MTQPDTSDTELELEHGTFALHLWWPLPNGGYVKFESRSDKHGLTSEDFGRLERVVFQIEEFRRGAGLTEVVEE